MNINKIIYFLSTIGIKAEKRNGGFGSMDTGLIILPDVVYVNRDSMVNAFPGDEDECYAETLRALTASFEIRFYWMGKDDDYLFLGEIK